MPPSSPDKRLFLRDLGLLLGVPLLVTIGLIYWWSPWPDKYDVASPDAIFTQVAGDWYWKDHDECGVRYHHIAFDSSQTVMTLVSYDPATDSTEATVDTTIYDLHGHSTHHLRGLIRGERRKSLVGRPVVWDLVLTSPNSYQWKQAGISSILGYSGEILRCSPSPSLSPVAPSLPGP